LIRGPSDRRPRRRAPEPRDELAPSHPTSPEATMHLSRSGGRCPWVRLTPQGARGVVAGAGLVLAHRRRPGSGEAHGRGRRSAGWGVAPRDEGVDAVRHVEHGRAASRRQRHWEETVEITEHGRAADSVQICLSEAAPSGIDHCRGIGFRTSGRVNKTIASATIGGRRQLRRTVRRMVASQCSHKNTRVSVRILPSSPGDTRVRRMGVLQCEQSGISLSVSEVFGIGLIVLSSPCARSSRRRTDPNHAAPERERGWLIGNSNIT
jgi:hypothetical protein